MPNAPLLAASSEALPADEVFPHPMLEDYGVEERRAMLGVRRFLERFLKRRPTVTEVVFAYHVLQRMR